VVGLLDIRGASCGSSGLCVQSNLCPRRCSQMGIMGNRSPGSSRPETMSSPWASIMSRRVSRDLSNSGVA